MHGRANPPLSMRSCRVLNLIRGLLLFHKNLEIILFQSLMAVGGIATGRDWNRYKSLGSTTILTVSILFDVSSGSKVHLLKVP
jgi:hypothetical protein